MTPAHPQRVGSRRRRRCLTLPGMSRRAGVTLIEMLIVLVMAGVLLSIASLRGAGIINRYQLGVAAEQLAGDLQRARLEAMRRNTPVTFTLTNDSTYQIAGINARRLYGSARFAVGAPASVQFSSLGRLVGGAATALPLQSPAGSKTVRVTSGGMAVVQ